MKKLRILLVLALLFLALHPCQAENTANGFIYKPPPGARGATEKSLFDAGMERVDNRLGKEIWVGDPNYGTTFREAVTAIDSANAILHLPAGTHTINDDLTIPANITVKPQRGVIFAIATAKTLTINGPLDASPSQIFSCTGTGKVVFGAGSVKEVYPEWWAVNGTPGTTNMAAAFQAAFNAFPIVRLQRNSYAIDNTTIYLDTTASNITYKLLGTGKNCLLKLNNFTTGYAFKLNETPGGAIAFYIPSPPHFVVEGIYVDGSGSTAASFCYVNTSSVHAIRVRFSYLKYGVYTSTYSDDMGFWSCYWNEPRSGGYLFKCTSGGDGFVFDQVFAGEGADVLYLTGCYGGNIRSCIQGKYTFDGCDAVTMENCHLEESGGFSVTISNCRMTLRNNYFFNEGVTYPIYINDDFSYDASRITLENNTFRWLNRSTLAARVPDVYIAAATSYTQLILRNNTAVNSQMDPVGGTRGSFDDSCGIVVASAVTAVQTAFDAALQWLSKDVELLRKNAVWSVKPLNGEFQLPYLSAPELDSYIGSQPYYGNLTAAHYYYQMAVWNGSAWSAKGTERNYNLTASDIAAGKQTIAISPAARTGYVKARIWRGTSAGTYDRYVDIPLIKSVGVIYDHGDHLDGFAWITSAVPTPPTANNTMDGRLRENGTREFYAAAAPSSAEFTGIKGDRVINNNPVAGQPKGWTCTVAGTPGTWVSEGIL
jgi:hypothetical protein